MGAGRSAMGNIAPEMKNTGIIRKFTISWKPYMSWRAEAIAVPKAVKMTAIRNMKRTAIGTLAYLAGRNPAIVDITRTITP